MKAADRAVLGVTLLLVAGPPLVDVSLGGAAAAIRYSATDAFYYHTVARNIATSGRISYDGTHPTNGFHPLWQAVLGGLYKACAWAGWTENAYLVASILVGTGLVSLSLVLLCGAALRARRRLPCAYPLFAVGIYGFAMAPVWYRAIDQLGIRNANEGPEPLYGTMWSFMNGMESALALALFGWLAFRFCRAGRRSAVVDAAALAALTLTRLDLVFLALPLLAWSTAGAAKQRRFRQAFGALGLYGAVLAAYLVTNRLYAGVAFPVSGATKTSFPHLVPYNFEALRIVRSRFVSDGGAYFVTWRVMQLLAPAVAAVALTPLLVARWRRLGGLRLKFTWADRFDRFLVVSGIGVCGLAAYDFLFVNVWNQGHWYFPVSIAWMTLAVVSLLDRLSPPGWLRGTVVALVAVASVAVFLRLQRRVGYHAEQAYAFSLSKTIRTRYAAVRPKVLEYDDGFVAFLTGFPALNALGLAVDVEAARALADGRLPRLAYDRGFSYVGTFSYNYADYSRMDAAQVMRAGRQLVGDGFDVELDYVLPNTRFTLLRFRPRRPEEEK